MRRLGYMTLITSRARLVNHYPRLFWAVKPEIEFASEPGVTVMEGRQGTVLAPPYIEAVAALAAWESP